jgi:hypothetical protein
MGASRARAGADYPEEVTSVTTLTDLPLPRLTGGADFARRSGQLRVSFTPRCQLGCVH